MGFVLKSFGVSWVLSEKVLDLMIGKRDWLGKHLSSIWNMADVVHLEGE